MVFEFGRAPYACDSMRTRGRLYSVDPSPTRSAFQRDRDRILHSTAFRRLKHKTQVFVYHEDDHFRTRLTHSLEVSQIARSITRALGCDEDLAEALALAHDLGHTPFGHAGEDALDACMAQFGGFDHNAQTLRIVTRLEKRYAEHDGLNLTWETLEGLVKHNGPLLDQARHPLPRYQTRGVPGAILEYDKAHDLALSTFASVEAQAAAIADDIAYNAHDIDDGLRAGLIDLENLKQVDFLCECLEEIEGRYPGLERTRVIHELMRRMITRFVVDAISVSQSRLASLAPTSADDVRHALEPVVALSPSMAKAERAVKAFLTSNLYHHPFLLAARDTAEAVVQGLFVRLTQTPGLLPEEWQEPTAFLDDAKIARRVADYIAGMTDRYAFERYASLFKEDQKHDVYGFSAKPAKTQGL